MVFVVSSEANDCTARAEALTYFFQEFVVVGSERVGEMANEIMESCAAIARDLLYIRSAREKRERVKKISKCERLRASGVGLTSYARTVSWRGERG